MIGSLYIVCCIACDASTASDVDALDAEVASDLVDFSEASGDDALAFEVVGLVEDSKASGDGALISSNIFGYSEDGIGTSKVPFNPFSLLVLIFTSLFARESALTVLLIG
jgi:hypothetical protein